MTRSEIDRKVKEISKKTVIPKASQSIKIAVGGVSKEELINGIKKEVYSLSDTVMYLLNLKEFTVSGLDKKETINLVFLSLYDLGFRENPRTSDFLSDEFCSEWSKKYLDRSSLELCQAEDSLHLFRQWKGQQRGTVLLMAMKPLKDKDGDQHVFYIETHVDGGRWLFCRWASHDRFWPINSSFAFRFRIQS